MAAVHKITTVDGFRATAKSVPENTLLAISFHTSWAAPCKQMNEVFSAIAASNPTSGSKTTFVSIDAEEVPDISEEYEVSAVPFFVLSRNGAVLKKISGADPQELVDAIRNLGGVNTTGSTLQAAIPPAQKVSAPTTTAASTDIPTANGANVSEDADGEVEPEESLNDRLSKLVSAAPVMLFMKGTPAAPQCGFSRQLVGILREHNIRYGFFNILKDDEVRQGLKSFSDWPTFPQLYHHGLLVGGLDIVKEEFENDPEYLKEEAVASS